MDRFEELLRARLTEDPVEIPAEVDAAVMATARQLLEPEPATARRRRWPLRLVPVAAAAAAAILLLVLWPGNEPGRPDVLDVFRLALRVERGEVADPTLDVDGDGRVDRGDVDALMVQAVALDPGRGR